MDAQFFRTSEEFYEIHFKTVHIEDSREKYLFLSSHFLLIQNLKGINFSTLWGYICMKTNRAYQRHPSQGL